jgi:predicted nucleic acid-binding protein
MNKNYRIYLDVCCLSRPFDDQSQLRVHLETEAVMAILQQCEENLWTLIDSAALYAEISQFLDPEKQQQIQVALNLATIRVVNSPLLQARIVELANTGFSFYDAAHIASAEKARADVFLSTDDRLVKRAKRLDTSIYVKIKNPLTWLTEVTNPET